MKTKAAAPVAARQRAPQTLTLDMDLLPAPVKPARKASAPKAPVDTPFMAAPPFVQAKPAVKKIPAKTPAPVSKAAGKAKTAVPETARVERDLALEGGRLWRMSGRHAVAYVQSASLACALLSVETRHLARHAMAVYYDKKGRAIAWQVRFDAQQWDDVIRQLG